MIRTERTEHVVPDWLRSALGEHFGLEGALRPLPGDRDLNLLLTVEEGTRWVVKVSAEEEAEDTLRFECDLMAWLREHGDVPVPGFRPTREGDPMARIPLPDGAPARVRILEHLPGRVLADVRPQGPGLLAELGRTVARMDRALTSCPHAPPPRPGFRWALAEAGGVIQTGLKLVPEEQRPLLEAALEAFQLASETFSAFPTQVIHGDVNDHNVLVSLQAGRPGVSGILDFGDSHAAPAVFDLAITLAYGAMGARDPIQAAAWITAGYHEVRPLSEAELDVLYPLMAARLAASVSVAAARRAGDEAPTEYHLVSEAPAWAMLESLQAVHGRLGRGILRDACGLPACPRSPGLVAWLASQDFSPVMEVDPADTTVLDLSVGSPVLTGRDTDDTTAFTRRCWLAMEDAGARVGIGRYDEPRGFYLTETFAGRDGEPPERRTVHVGIDIFDEPGAPVTAFTASVVRSVHENEGRLDYGPTVILEHDSPEGPFWTLYGHLERASVAQLRPGQTLDAGEPFARVGPFPENGDWPPHLHFQIVTDLLGHEHDFPGVALPRERGVWTSFSPDPNLVLRLPLDTTYRDPGGLEERRKAVLGPSLSLSYDRPIHVVRGKGAYLYDDLGREYLDCVNNVAHVGHEHPWVVAAGREQMGVLNTNTRYLHEAVLEYAESLSAHFPHPLSVCFFVNSGSEANELALRMARVWSGGRGVVAVEGGYHGNTQGLVEVSHYKFAGAGGGGAPGWVRAVPMPDGYRGRYREDDPEAGTKYAAHVADALAELADEGHTPAAFLCESILSCGGQIELPEGFLTEAVAHTRAAGGLYIADEVQVGFGRVGSHMWGFETHGVVPDIVTLGKPMGNGHPMGAVVTTREIAQAFDNGMEFFSTFGGNPVSARIGQAVLEVMEGEELQAHAARVGAHLKEGLAALMDRHPVVGDVRGSGLFLGLEFVSDRAARTPAPEAADYAVQRMRERNVLLSTDGPDHNVIKIKPPLVFSEADADRVVEELDAILYEDPVRSD